MDAPGAAKVFAALGNEGRLFIFQLLLAAGPGGMRAGEIAQRAGQLQNTTSSSLAILSHAGLISARRDGRSIIYAAAPAGFGEAAAFLTGNPVAVDGEPPARRSRPP